MKQHDGVKGQSPLWGPGAKPLVGSKGEALVGAADCCKGIIFTNFVENGALNSNLELSLLLVIDFRFALFAFPKPYANEKFGSPFIE
jgi:hypothetical protein